MLRVILAFWGSYFCKKNFFFQMGYACREENLWCWWKINHLSWKFEETQKEIHDAPNIYAFLVVEVVRRRKFSSTFTEVGNYFFLSGSITELLNEAVCVINILWGMIFTSLGVHLLLYGRTLKRIIVSYFFIYDATILNFENSETCLNWTLSKPESWINLSKLNSE